MRVTVSFQPNEGFNASGEVETYAVIPGTKLGMRVGEELPRSGVLSVTYESDGQLKTLNFWGFPDDNDALNTLKTSIHIYIGEKLITEIQLNLLTQEVINAVLEDPLFLELIADTVTEEGRPGFGAKLFYFEIFLCILQFYLKPLPNELARAYIKARDDLTPQLKQPLLDRIFAEN